ncbi:Conserved_hypothetical protein [Hexamita inflata]|uniref:Nuclear factor related to kappa-B-binding protein second winged helix domain-containing protein n=1 Tax=Hexamita inflata TaxID=28002 RepID=A0AA86PR46_9EUKA|nr:Conserved hypothetical protein [Hexamita inflata]
MNERQIARILDQRAVFDQKVRQLYREINNQSSEQALENKLNQTMDYMTYESHFSPTCAPYDPLKIQSKNNLDFSADINSVMRAQINQNYPNFGENISLCTQMNQSEVKQLPQKFRTQLASVPMKQPAYTDPFTTFQQQSRYVRDEDLQLNFQPPKIKSYNVKRDCVIESQGKPSANQLYYKFAISQEEGELFGLKFDRLTNTAKTQNKHQLQDQQNKIEFKQGEFCDYSINKQKYVLANNQTQFTPYYPIVQDKLVPDNVRMLNCSVENMLNVQKQNIPVNIEFSKPYDIQAYMKQIFTQQRVKLQQIRLQTPTTTVQKPKACSQSYDAKFANSKNFNPNYNISYLNGFQKNSTPEQFLASKRACPSICHFIVCLLAHQQTCVKLRDEDVFYATIPTENIQQKRCSMLIKHMIIAFKDNFPRARELLPANTSYFESILTALFSMISPDDEIVTKQKFASRNSFFDQYGGNLTDFTPDAEDVELFQFKNTPLKSEFVYQHVNNNQSGLLEVKTEVVQPQVKPKTEVVQTSLRTFIEQIQGNGVYRKLQPGVVYKMLNNSVFQQSPCLQQLQAAIENNSQMYLTQNQVLIIEGNEITPIKLSLDEINLMLGKTKEEPTEEQEESDQVADQIEKIQWLQTPVIDLVSPLLGEFQLHLENQEVDNYFGVNKAYLNHIAHLVNYQLKLDAQEKEQWKTFDFTKIQQSQTNQNRIQVVKTSKMKVVNSLQINNLGYSDTDRAYFRAQERIRYFLLPHTIFCFVVRGYKTFHDRVHKTDAKSRQMAQTYKYLDFARQIPSVTTKLALVIDSCSRLPGRFGTREDICERCADSHFFNCSDAKFVNKVSCAMDRMRMMSCDKEKKIKYSIFNSSDKLWTVMSQRYKTEYERTEVDLDDFPSDLYDIYEKMKGIQRMAMNGQLGYGGQQFVQLQQQQMMMNARQQQQFVPQYQNKPSGKYNELFK